MDLGCDLFVPAAATGAKVREMDFVSEGVFVLALKLLIVPRFDPFLLGEKIKTQIFLIPTQRR